MSNALKGFASMSPERRTEIARKGGQTAQAKGTGHKWTVEQAREAGKKGGSLTQGRRRAREEERQERRAEVQA